MRDRHGWRNWGRTQQCDPAAVELPGSELEVAEAIRRADAAGQRVKVVGSGHSFTDIACTDGRMLSLDRLNRVLAVDERARLVTVEAGITIARLNEELAARGLALPNLGDIDRQSIAGAVATATHGTGARFGGLATFLRGLHLITADGETLRCSPDEEPEVFHVARVGLGALGVVTRVTLQCVPAFTLRHVERRHRLADVLADLDRYVDANEHFEFYWLPHTDSCATIENNRTDEPAQVKSAYKRWRAEVFYPNYFFGAVVAAGRAAPSLVPRLNAIVAGALGTTELIQRSDRVLISTRLVRFAEMEYAVPRARAREAVDGVREVVERRGLRVSFPIEVRFVAPDDIPLSTASGRDTCYVAVHMARGVPYEEYFRGVEAVMDGLDGRPHWGKLHFQTAATLAPRYPEWERFQAVRRKLDPEGRFSNAYLDRVLGPN
ncbi:MAG TPA: D-arabinono-1,4-lactone oxidase [Acidimicrobiia bacterium]|jgi:L-gulonolactone oxidase|nr:D-arabinono-1,4-lactone oxidase [Acidimicrobiia bacterium]HEV3452315.1 D-arabinono-1,4-lactone oxidase [Acidimicrobiia bacterium]